MKYILLPLVLSSAMYAQGPEVTSWIINTTGATGYGGIQSNVQQVQYSSSNVYVSATCIPGYAIGPWMGLPASQVPVNENFVYKITRNPVQNTGTLTTIGGGHIGVWSNGVSIFNAQDAYSWNNQNIWHRDAVYFEGSTFDNCLGHPAPNGEYHTHLNPTCLYNDSDSLNHSPIVGYSFDGFPVYGAYAYTNANGTGPIKRMKSSYRLRSISTRTSLPNGTVLSSSQYGPAVSTTYPPGYFLEDYEYISALGDLDDHNGRWCVTPDYPSGIYAYFVTIDGNLKATFPYVIYGTYYGVVQPGNTGPMGGHNTISESVTTYTPSPASVAELSKQVSFEVSPNPDSGYLHLFIESIALNDFQVIIKDVNGKTVYTQSNIQPTIKYTFDLTSLAKGMYFLTLKNLSLETTKKIIIE